jgi:hypothetical protein
MWNLSRLQETEAAELYESLFAASSEPLIERLRELVENPPTAPPNIDRLADELNELIYDALSCSVGDRSPRPKHWKWFWSSALADAAAYRDTCYRKWRRAVGLAKTDWWIRHREAHLAFRRDIKAARRRAYRGAFCNALERDFVRATSKIRTIRRRRQQQHSLSTQMDPAPPPRLWANTYLQCAMVACFHPIDPIPHHFPTQSTTTLLSTALT